VTPDRKKILVVEDNRADAVLLQDMLMRDAPGQFDLGWTSSLRETLERMERERFDAILLDLSLPDSHGLATISRLCAAAPAMPILVMTGLTDEQIATEAVRCGAEDYLVKGQTDARSIVRAIRYAIDRKQVEDALKAAKNSAECAKAAAEQANRAKDHFLAVLSHELRTPLTPVVMGLSMLRDRPGLDPAIGEILEMVRRNIELEARLIDDLLDVSRIAQGKIELARGTVELCTIINRAVEVCRPDIEARRLHFGVDFGPAAPYWVQADVPRLQQVFWNLLKNAIKFTPHGGCVGIRCRPEENHVIVEVSDSGIGIEREALSRIFNAFEQAERSITRQFGGLGLGLAISRALVEMHGGQIEAQSAGRDKGATFRVRLPLAAAPGQPGVRAPAVPPRRAVRPLRILLVEDHGVTAKMMRMVLTSDGHSVETAGDVATALDLAGRQAFDLLLSDLGLPDGSGYDLMRQLRERGHKFPAVALSGYGQGEDIQRSREAGFAAHLTKPASREAVVEAVASVAAGERPATSGEPATLPDAPIE
jgi:two-component system CheB/CheR fusion protein